VTTTTILSLILSARKTDIGNIITCCKNRKYPCFLHVILQQKSGKNTPVILPQYNPSRYCFSLKYALTKKS
jgi:hypothetical protein